MQNLYETDRVKNGVFQAMMEVGLVNDGPVGVDYRSENGAVNSIQYHLQLLISTVTEFNDLKSR